MPAILGESPTGVVGERAKTVCFHSGVRANTGTTPVCDRLRGSYGAEHRKG